jgi:hypothetical protein
MKLRKYTLFIDESGYANPKSYKKSRYFIISGCIVDSREVKNLKEHLNQIKFAHWREKWHGVLLRSADIGLGKGRFSELYNLDENKERTENSKMFTFSSDMRKFFSKSYFNVITCLIDKEQAVKNKKISLNKGNKTMKFVWDQKLVYELSYKHILRTFLSLLVLRKAKGKIMAEASSDNQDIILYKEFFSLLSNGISDLEIGHLEAKERLSSLNFVTKKDDDYVEEQIADLMGYASKLYFREKNKLDKDRKFKNYEKMILQAYKHRLLIITEGGSDKRLKKISKNIEPYIVIPDNKKTS